MWFSNVWDISYFLNGIEVIHTIFAMQYLFLEIALLDYLIDFVMFSLVLIFEYELDFDLFSTLPESCLIYLIILHFQDNFEIQSLHFSNDTPWK